MRPANPATQVRFSGGSTADGRATESVSWARREIVNVADVDLDGTPDLLWRDLDAGYMY